MLQNGVSHRCACVKLSTKGGIAPFRGSAKLPEKVSCDMGYYSDSIAISRDMGPLSLKKDSRRVESGTLGHNTARASCEGICYWATDPGPRNDIFDDSRDVFSRLREVTKNPDNDLILIPFRVTFPWALKSRPLQRGRNTCELRNGVANSIHTIRIKR